MPTTIARDFYDLRSHIIELEPRSIRDELSELVTGWQDAEPAPLSTLVGLHEIAYDFNGKDDVIELVEGIEEAILEVPDSDTETIHYLTKHTIGSILAGFGQVDSHRQAPRDMEHLSREAAWLTEYFTDPRQEALALYSVSKAITGSRAANTVDNHGPSLFWDALGHLEDAGKAARAEEDPEVRYHLLGLIAQQATQNISTAEMSGAIDGPNMGTHFIERVQSLVKTLFADAITGADASFFTGESSGLGNIADDPLGLSAEKSSDHAKPQTATGRMAQRLVHRLVATAS